MVTVEDVGDVEMYRPSLDETLMHCAFAWSMRGTCSRAHVGAVFARDGRIVSTGYNGAPVGMTHCDHRTYEVATSTAQPDWVRAWFTRLGVSAPLLKPGTQVRYDNGVVSYGTPNHTSCVNSVHAEANAVAFAARHGVSLAGSTLYTTLLPCLVCAQLVVNVGATRVVAAATYRDAAGRELLVAAGVRVNVIGTATDDVHV